jgi:hypothetical protein
MNMKSKYSNILFFALLLAGIFMISCEDRDDDDVTDLGGGDQTEFVSILTNQVNEVIIPTVNDYAASTNVLSEANASFNNEMTAINLEGLIDAYQEAYLNYQAVAVHNYYATANQGLVESTNLYPIDSEFLDTFIAEKSYDFSTTAQQRANGFPVMDFMFFGSENTLEYLTSDPDRLSFLTELIASINDRASNLAAQWSGSLRENFINNGGTGLGSSISVQLNDHLLYYEEHIRENKVGIPIGRLGPNDDLITPDPTKIEAYYQSLVDGNDAFALKLLRASIEEVEDMYLGSTFTDSDGIGYDDLVIKFSDPTIDLDIKAQFSTIYEIIDGRTSITGDDSLYDAIQKIVTLYKSDLFPVLNVQDADGANDGD